MARRRASTSDAAVRVRHLLALDADQVLRRLERRQLEMLTLFSRLRERAPLLEAVDTQHGSITFGELALLTPAEQLAVARFYERLEALRWYLRYTEDMPQKVQTQLALHLDGLRAAHGALAAALGPPDGHGGPVVDAAPKKGKKLAR